MLLGGLIPGDDEADIDSVSTVVVDGYKGEEVDAPRTEGSDTLDSDCFDSGVTVGVDFIKVVGEAVIDCALVGVGVGVLVGEGVEVGEVVVAGVCVGVDVFEIVGVTSGSVSWTVKILESPAELSLEPVYLRSFKWYSPGPLYPESR